MMEFIGFIGALLFFCASIATFVGLIFPRLWKNKANNTIPTRKQILKRGLITAIIGFIVGAVGINNSKDTQQNKTEIAAKSESAVTDTNSDKPKPQTEDRDTSIWKKIDDAIGPAADNASQKDEKRVAVPDPAKSIHFNMDKLYSDLKDIYPSTRFESRMLNDGRMDHTIYINDGVLIEGFGKKRSDVYKVDMQLVYADDAYIEQSSILVLATASHFKVKDNKKFAKFLSNIQSKAAKKYTKTKKDVVLTENYEGYKIQFKTIAVFGIGHLSIEKR
ncbi:hypothetical protein HPC37_06205 [Pasteurellaceae bacterium 20609_3]|uniref:hypothetical protein n=1 Tax=Spirabiliibacterium mucosae TaxID=28156 RepID=UPI001AAC54AA|nr:hypothetical protein [Spirabiliibacterium mucosae]MBE2898408.1 hypothetical protein [Spirabiliibacterium mucosae]